MWKKRKNLISERIADIKCEIDNIETQLNEINEDRRTQYLETINKIFKSVPNTKIVCGYSTTFSFKTLEGNSDYFNMYVRDNWETGKLESIETSFYSTTTDSEEELDRMINLGIIAKLIRENKENILCILNNNREYYKKLTSEIYKEKTSLVTELRELESEFDDIEKDMVLEKAKSEGITFETPKVLQVKVDHSIWSCLGFKILSMTPTGKSATIDVSYEGFNGEVDTYTVKNVRMNFLNRYLR